MTHWSSRRLHGKFLFEREHVINGKRDRLVGAVVQSKNCLAPPLSCESRDARHAGQSAP